MTEVRELTDFPKLFTCYWGGFRAKSSCQCASEIIANRNAFGRFLGAKARVCTGLQAERQEILMTYSTPLDHLEFYKDSLGRCLQVCSLYEGNYPSNDKLASEGWVQIKQIYATNATSYARFIDMTAIRAKRDIIATQWEINEFNEQLSQYPTPTSDSKVLIRKIETRRKRIEAMRLHDCAKKQYERVAWLDEIRAL